MTFHQILKHEAEKTGKMIIGVSKGFKTAKFIWEDSENCNMVCVGFDDAEIDSLIEQKAHEGVDINGYECSIH